MSLSKMVNISLMGRTGDGKSSLGNLIFRLLGGDHNRTPFSEGSSTHSHTRESQSVVVHNVKITDHPGLVDSDGASQDENNIALIVKNLKEDKLVHGFLLVINEQSPRFDWAMQNALKLIVDTFGGGILSVTGVVFTHSYKVSEAKAQEFMAGLRPMITDLTGVDVPGIKFWQVDSHPEEYFADSPAKLSSMVARNHRTVEGIRGWVSANRPFDALKAFPSKYQITELVQKFEEEIVKLKESGEEANERARKAEEAYVMIRNETTRLMLEMELRNAREIDELVKMKNSEYSFWRAVDNIVSIVVTAAANKFTAVLNNAFERPL